MGLPKLPSWKRHKKFGLSLSTILVPHDIQIDG